METTHLNRLRAGFVLTLLACVSPAVHAATPRSAIEFANKRFMTAMGQGDAAALAELYAPEGQVMPPGSEPVRGREAIRNYWQGALASGIAAVALETVEVFSQGTTATEVGRYELRAKDGKALDRGKYIVVWRRKDGKWQLLRDMFSTNISPAGTSK